MGARTHARMQTLAAATAVVCALLLAVAPRGAAAAFPWRIPAETVVEFQTTGAVILRGIGGFRV